tara:strand:+ start:2309 stop:2575 length:267 start_codon:yes stop_codon:yes gene_type:complete
MKKPDRLPQLVTSFVMAGFMSTALSAVFTYLAFGFSAAWVLNWAQSVLIAWPIAMGLDLLFGARLRHLSAAISKQMERKKSREELLCP